MADIGGVEAQDDIFARDARCGQLLGHRSIGAIVLNPDFSSNNVNVDDGAMDAAMTVPADVQDLEVISPGVYHCFGVDLAVRRLVLRVFFDDAADNLTVSLYSIHVVILSCCSSNTSKRS